MNPAVEFLTRFGGRWSFGTAKIVANLAELCDFRGQSRELGGRERWCCECGTELHCSDGSDVVGCVQRDVGDERSEGAVQQQWMHLCVELGCVRAWWIMLQSLSVEFALI